MIPQPKTDRTDYCREGVKYNKMTKAEIRQTESVLLDFISRASQENARPEEVAVLPGVVGALIQLSSIGPND